jgi:hypothetical protein
MNSENRIMNTSPESSRVFSRKALLSLLITVGVIIGLVGTFVYKAVKVPPPPAAPPQVIGTPDPLPPVPPVATPIDKQAIRARAFSVAVARLDTAEAEFADAATKAADKHLATIDSFFEERSKGTRAFAEQLLSLKGKWKFVRGQIWTDEEKEHAKFIRTEFEKYVFTPEDLNKVIAGAIAGYVVEIQGLENQLLLQLRADISQSDLAAAEVLPVINSQEKFDAEYRQVLTVVTPLIAKDLRTDVAREMASFIASDIAARIAVKMLTVLATKIGISSGILSSGAVSSVSTLGIGIVAAILVDLLLDEILKAAGHDPASSVAERVNDILSEIRDTIKEGVAQAKADWNELRELAESDPDAEVRVAAAKASDSIARSGNLGLRRELLQIHEHRAFMRREAVKQLVLSVEK